MSQSIENKMVSRIYGNKRGWVFTPDCFYDLGSRVAVAQSLVRLAKSGTIRRLTRGLYDYPAKHPDFGEMSPSVERLTAALAEKDNLKIQPSGAYAANLLGLSDQVPAKIALLTDGSTRVVQVGNWHIMFKKTSPKNMATAGRVSGLVIQALRYMKQRNIDEKIINSLKRRLSAEDKKQLISDIRYAPAWIGEIFKQLNS